MKRPAVTVTDHALIRYLERVAEFDLDAVRSLIAQRVKPAIAAGASGITIDGATYVLDGAIVVSIVPGRRAVKPGERP